jgi:sorbose reductase
VNCAALEATVTSLQAEFPSAKVVGKTVDITDEDVVNGSVDAVAAELGPITTLVCFAGIVDCRHALETKASTWRRIIDVNMTGAFIRAQAVAKQMVAAKTGGSIVFTASISAHRVNFPQPQAAYNVSKAAVVAMKNSLAAEWARYGIRVNTISPGYMDTILNEGAGLEEARNIWASRNPMGRMGFPSEIQGAVVLLASGAGSYINGTDILCDGGAIVF